MTLPAGTGSRSDRTACAVVSPGAAGPVFACPRHPGTVLVPFPGGAARGLCPVDGASHQLEPPEAGS